MCKNLSSIHKEHYYWIDWMKSLGMYSIIAGHFFPKGHEYLYVFSVPLFFITSGFLSKIETDESVFWAKILHNLLLPCIVICIFMFLIDILKFIYLGTFDWEIIPMYVLNCIIGAQGENTEAGGLKLCWFVYTLILCKVINQYIGRNGILRVGFVSICLLIALWYDYMDFHLYNSIVNTSLAYPLFVAGGGGGKILYNSCYNRIVRIKPVWSILCTIICVILVYTIRWQNGAPWMYDNRFGENIILFFIGAFAGTILVFIISYYLQNKKLYLINVISEGTIIILGFQKLFIRLFKHFPTFYNEDLLKYLYAFIILVLFVPIIKLSERYFPILLGIRAKGKIK